MNNTLDQKPKQEEACSNL